MTTLALASELQSIPKMVIRSPLAGFEMVRGYGVPSLPFDTGNILALRVFPQNDFAPYITIWHRTPEGEWSIHVDGPRLDTACPRYFGAGAKHSTFAKIQLQWLDPMSLSIQMNQPRLDWTISMDEPSIFHLMNIIIPRLPERFVRTPRSFRLREWVGSALLGLGKVSPSAVTPNGQSSMFLTRRMFVIKDAKAQLDGKDLGRPVSLAVNPAIGNFKLPARPVFAEGRSYFETLDPAEYIKVKQELENPKA
jgi:hypothetical protein